MTHIKTLKDLMTRIPDPCVFDPGIRRAPKRSVNLSPEDQALALRNALRYIPKAWHETLAPEFLAELLTRGRIYGYRFRPKERMRGKPLDAYQGRTLEGKAFQVMIDNNLDPEVALYPYELVTYGETGQVCQNWMQYRLIKAYLEDMTHHQTLVVMSGHPLGLFASDPSSPRVIITNGLMVGFADDQDHFNRAAAIGVANYGQMTAGGWMYIGPQGIVHGTYSTLLNAGRLKLGLGNEKNLQGKLFVSSGLGGMSGAQGKAITIAGGVGIICEVDRSRIETRKQQGWVSWVTDDAKAAFARAKEAQKAFEAMAIAYHGNVVDLLEYAVDHHIEIDLLSDQTSCHAVYDGGYTPVGLSFEERTALLEHDKDRFKRCVDDSLKRHYLAIKTLSQRHTYFFDYGNSFLKALYDSGIKEICQNGINDSDGFVFQSYVEDIMGPILFDYGYGPFRWVCLSGKEDDLKETDRIALMTIDKDRRFQDLDNWLWIKHAEENKLVVGTKARILYSDAKGRMDIALAFNKRIREGKLGPIMLGRDHHDTGGTDSPFRETANIRDGSNIMADMATQVALGNASRGMSLVALHNGGGVGIGKAINGGYGMVLDGSLEVDHRLQQAMTFDVMAGVARRAWATNPHAMETAILFNHEKEDAHVTIPEVADDALISRALRETEKKGAS